MKCQCMLDPAVPVEEAYAWGLVTLRLLHILEVVAVQEEMYRCRQEAALRLWEVASPCRLAKALGKVEVCR